LPPGVEPAQAVAAVHSALTAVIGLFERARLRAGDTLFINGGSGSVGVAVLQIAKACGARVAVTAGDAEKAAWCRKMGADRVVDYHVEELGAALRDFAPAGLDIFWEATPALDIETVLPALAKHGRIIVIAGMERRCDFPAGPFYTRNCELHGFIVTGTGPAKLHDCARQINAWLSNGTLQAKIGDVLPLSQAAAAHQREERGGLSGKIVLVPDELFAVYG
jgi:NADPH2:quinone reductase